uniref:Variant surface glycoprotein 413 n=1 Tax=Trypanosoma brucei TaxID=5691 RepID=M4SX01_9TRYP|nr:variant surface glycoprotein 413 [Trypanosoma brucei]
MSAATGLFLVLTLIVRLQGADGAIGANANTYEFKRLCKLAALAYSKPAAATIADAATDSYQKIQRLNMTLSDAAWQAMFKKDKNGKDWPQEPPVDTEAQYKWTPFWKDWSAAAKWLSESSNDADIRKEAKIDTLKPEAAALARAKLSTIARRAWTLKEELNRQTDSESDTSSETNAETLIQEAVFGKAQQPTANLDGGAAFTATSNTRADNCKVDADGKGATSVAATIICLCATTTTDLTHSPCFYTNNAPGDWNGQKDGAQAQWSAIKKFCGLQTDRQEPTADLIQTLLDETLSNLQVTEASKAHLGAYLATGCSGTSSAGVCVEYTITTSDPKPTLDKTPWVTKLRAASRQLKQAEQRAEATTRLTTALKSELIAAMHAAAEAAAYTAQVQPLKQSKSQHSQKEVEVDCHKHHGNNTTCPKDKCTYDDKEKKCNPITQAEETAEKAGGKDGRNESKCGEAKTEEECKKVPGKIPEGKKAVCGWIEGKCQDSSFLLNRKFALMVSTFSALLF